MMGQFRRNTLMNFYFDDHQDIKTAGIDSPMKSNKNKKILKMFDFEPKIRL